MIAPVDFGRYHMCDPGDYGDYHSRCSVILERNEQGDIVRRAAVVLGDGEEDVALARLFASAPELLDELKRLTRAYVNLLSTGRDRILDLGGQCDAVETMEASDPALRIARAAVAKSTGSAS